MRFFILTNKKFKIGLALGGGGARGLAHVGVISVLEKEGIPIDIITGTSVGSVIGAFYALYRDSEKLKVTAVKYSNQMNQINKQINFQQFKDDNKKFLPWGRLTEIIKKGIYLHTEMSKICINDGILIENLLKGVLGEKEFSDTKIIFNAVAADLISGKEIVLKEGILMQAVMASCSIPGVFPPVKHGKNLLVDGGIIDNVPIQPLRELGADFIIASDVSKILRRKLEYKNAIDILLRSDSITSKELRRIQLDKSDFIISPEIHQIDWWNFSKPENCIQKGEEAAQKLINELKKALRLKQIKNNLKKLFFN